ncbi:unnamed protein product [Dovyalis caffra]|uniref:Uncharacterized protein n=1 Tax=Dovyalis caffra TaxID=77055 RepID=A0AAV1RAS6_9ROSI|nr:unnamed protein product [Dovyalis caffra]
MSKYRHKHISYEVKLVPRQTKAIKQAVWVLMSIALCPQYSTNVYRWFQRLLTRYKGELGTAGVVVAKWLMEWVLQGTHPIILGVIQRGNLLLVGNADTETPATEAMTGDGDGDLMLEVTGSDSGGGLPHLDNIKIAYSPNTQIPAAYKGAYVAIFVLVAVWVLMSIALRPQYSTNFYRWFQRLLTRYKGELGTAGVVVAKWLME